MRRVALLSYFWVSALMLSSCTTGEKMSRLRDGMSRSEVETVLGRPDGFKRVGEYEHLQYSHRMVTGWAWDRADYNVILKDGRVVEYGTGEVRVKEGPTATMILIPVR